MPILQIEHAVSEFEVWQRAFDSDPLSRKESGVRGYRVFRPLDDPRYVEIELDFDSASEAEAFRAALERLWSDGRATPALAGAPRTRIVEQVQAERY